MDFKGISNAFSQVDSYLSGRNYILIDVMGVIRQGGSVLFEGISSVGSALTALGAVQAICLIASGLNKTRAGISNARKALQEKDFEAFFLQASIYFPAGISQTSVGLSLLVNKVAALARYANVAASAGQVLIASSVIFSSFLVARAVSELASAKELSDELEKNKDNLDGMIAILKEPFESPSNELNRQTGDKCKEQLETFFSIDHHTDEEKKALMRAIFEANYRTQVRSYCLLGNAIYGFFAAAVAMTTSGIAIPIVYGIGSTLWLASDSSWLSDQIGSRFWEQKKYEILPENCREKKEKPEIDDKETEFWVDAALAICAAPIWVVPAVLYHESKALL